MEVFIFGSIIFFAAGLVQGVTGFGAGLIAIPLLCLIIDVKIAVPLCILNGLMITSYLAIKLWSFLDRRKIIPLLVGAMPGTILGAILLKQINPVFVKYLIGIILVTYSSYNLLVRPKPFNPHVIWGYLAGFCTGTITALVSAGGAPAIIYTTSTDWKKNEIKATLTGFFVLNATFAAAVHALSGMTTVVTLKFFATTAPFVLLGTALGTKVSNRVNRRLYLQVVYCFLIIMGILMFW